MWLLVRSGFGAALYEHESAKIVAPKRKYSQFCCEVSAYVPFVGLWLDSSLYPPMAIGGRDNGRPLPADPPFRASDCPFFATGSLTGYALPLHLLILMPIKSGKVCASPKIFFAAW